MVVWDDKYSTGIERIDDQHKRLFEYVNTLEQIVNEQSESPELLMEMMNFFEHYTRLHFGDEENCMHRYHCPITHANVDAHKRFIEYFEKMKNVIQTEGYQESLFVDMLRFTEDWIVQHIYAIDTQLKPCVHNKGERA